MEPVALSIAAALFILALLRMPGLTAPALAFAQPGTGTMPGDEDEELPQTDRAPSRPWLGWTVAGVAALRLVLLLVFQA
ncbi:MAG: hypothetical protein E6J88_19715 [Deltaproteobacteria bacterium]|nr:MAG: hypothetical protein E6J88_19715 [Deltaproteobacteria bacterium]